MRDQRQWGPGTDRRSLFLCISQQSLGLCGFFSFLCNVVTQSLKTQLWICFFSVVFLITMQMYFWSVLCSSSLKDCDALWFNLEILTYSWVYRWMCTYSTVYAFFGTRYFVCAYQFASTWSIQYIVCIFIFTCILIHCPPTQCPLGWKMG